MELLKLCQFYPNICNQSQVVNQHIKRATRLQGNYHVYKYASYVDNGLVSYVVALNINLIKNTI